MGRDEFLAELAARFPEVSAEITEFSAGLLHAEMGTFEAVQ